jgi:hypothetical protein
MQNLQERRAKPGKLPKNNRSLNRDGAENRGREAARSPLPAKDDVIMVLIGIRWELCHEQRRARSKKPGAIFARASCATLSDYAF